MNGQGTLVPGGRLPVDGDTIVNLKLGMRYTDCNRTVYAGWGHSLTGDRWYRDIFRVEYELRF